MLFSTMCWLFCYVILIILDKIVHHISNESEEIYNFILFCFNLKNN